LNTILVQASAWALVNRGNPNYLISAGRVFYKMGRLDDAEKAFSMAYKIEPGNEVIHEYQNRINEQKGKNQK
jgi:tetratricopeptide (TPR) repeat protein